VALRPGEHAACSYHLHLGNAVGRCLDTSGFFCKPLTESTEQGSNMNDTWKKNALGKIETIFRDHFLDDSLRVGETTTPADIEEWDSLAHINLLAAVESEFGVRFSADDMAGIDSVASMLQALGRLVKG
jgi:acyl carrier protein